MFKKTQFLDFEKIFDSLNTLSISGKKRVKFAELSSLIVFFLFKKYSCPFVNNSITFSRGNIFDKIPKVASKEIDPGD